MDERLVQKAYGWWVKLTPLWKKFVRETYLWGYEKEDLEQECYLQLVKCLEKFDETLGVPFESYYKIQLYGWRANENRKKRDLVSLNEEMYEWLNELPDDRMSVETKTENKLLFEKIVRELAQMKDMDRIVVTEYYIKDRSLKDIAKELDIKYKAAEFRKGKALKHLKEILA